MGLLGLLGFWGGFVRASEVLQSQAPCSIYTQIGTEVCLAVVSLTAILSARICTRRK